MRFAILISSVLLLAATALAAGGGRTADNDNSFDLATPIASGGFVTDTLDTVNDPADFYKVTAVAGNTLNVSVFIHDYQPSDPGKVNFNVVAYNQLRQELAASRSNFRYDTFCALALVNGTYYIKVETVSGSGGYTLDYSAATPQKLVSGSEIHGYLSNSGNRVSDWYRISLRGGADAEECTATLHEEAASSNFDLYFLDLWDGYSFWYDVSWWSDPDEKVSAVATYTGDYYLQVNAYNGSGNYVLRVSVAPVSADGDSSSQTARPVSYNTTRNDHIDQAADHFDWYRTSLAQGESITAVLKLDPMPSDMYALSVLNPDLTTLESKTNYVAGATPSLNREILLKVTAPAAGTYYVVAMAKVALKSTIVDISDGNARSDYTISINLSAHSPPPENHAPVAKFPGMVAAVDPNTEYILDTSALFSDQDSDTLRITWDTKPHFSVSILLNGSVRFTPEANWAGGANFTITAADPYDLNVTAFLDLTVRNIPLPPQIKEKAPAQDPEGRNGTILNFRVGATDPAGGQLTYQWTVDGTNISSATNSLDWRVPRETGTALITVTVSNARLSATANWTVYCRSRVPLEVSIISPFNNSLVKRGDPVRFFGYPLVPSRDIPGYTLSWTLGGREFSILSQFIYKDLPVGRNTITLTATNMTDGTLTARTTVVVTVEETQTAVNYTIVWPVLAVVIAAAVGGLIYFDLRRRRNAALAARERKAGHSPRRSRRRKRQKRRR